MSRQVVPLSVAIVGTWSLTSRVIRTGDGRRVPSHLGEDPVGMLIYDRHGNFSAQFMKRNRDGGDTTVITTPTRARNNTGAVGGYDAYFGSYIVDDSRSEVTQTLVGSLSPTNVGEVLTRSMTVDGDELRIEVDTETPDGEAALITLTWRRAGGSSDDLAAG